MDGSFIVNPRLAKTSRLGNVFPGPERTIMAEKPITPRQAVPPLTRRDDRRRRNDELDRFFDIVEGPVVLTFFEPCGAAIAIRDGESGIEPDRLV